MNKLIVILVLISISHLNYGQGFIKMDTIDAPDDLKNIIHGKIKRTLVVDFNGDNKSDFICQLDSIDQITSSYKEIWITSDLKKIKTIDKFLTDYDFFWFVNIDDDPEPELFSASGYSDGIDYCFIDQNFITGDQKVLFYFNPIILKGENIYWGYPWDLNDLILQNDKSSIKLYCSLEHEIMRDGAIFEPEWQIQYPVISFKGLSTQENVHIGNINKFEWLEINELLERIILKK